MRPKDFVKVLDSINKSMGGLRKQMTLLERQRLKDNFNKIPKDITYLTKSEAELKRDLVNTTEEGQEFVEMLKKELKRLRREHYENEQGLQNMGDEINQNRRFLQEII